ncbi:MAG: helix-turn-helix domain-containing protein [Planctomycetaceae bacterium]|nr:helix-turn-helix domain-containing protein [Planctomycetaceae bacterium]
MSCLTEHLRERLLASGNISRIAKTTGIPQQVLQRFASGKQANLRLDTAEKLMKQLGIQWSDPRGIELIETASAVPLDVVSSA